LPLLSTVVALVRQYHHFHGALNQLRDYSDRQLADMNIDRGDFARIAWLEGERRAARAVQPRRKPVRKFEAGSLKLAFAGQR
jgi:hypothetical protein